MVAVPAEGKTRKPNILVIVADDLGWSDLGAFGGEIATPNLDRLARSGMRLTNFHTSPSCSPSRAMLLTGVDNHEVGLGTMAEEQTAATRGRPGYEGHLNGRAATIAQLMRQRSYRTMMAGKWHLGLANEDGPAARGFDRSFALLEGGANHYGVDQNAAWKKIEPADYREDGAAAIFPTGKYSTDLYADKLIGYIEEASLRRQPFFAYLAFTAPHWPLQAPAPDIDKYRGKYDDGPAALRLTRLARQKKLGLVPQWVSPQDMVNVPAWDSLTPTERGIEARKMEVYAAMVDNLDQAVGRLLAGLRKTGQLRNTLIVFLSDNGPEGLQVTSPKGIKDPAVITSLGIDNSLANLGTRSSYFGYGPGWAQASASPSWLYKSYMTEGGIRAPAFVTGPGVAAGGVIGRDVHVTDIAPTLLAATGGTQPRTFEGRDILSFEGRNLLSWLSGRVADERANRTSCWELFGGRAVRRGRWKAVYFAPWQATRAKLAGGPGWRLFDMRQDPAEANDLANSHPVIIANLVTAWQRYAQDKGVIVDPGDAARDEAVLRRADLSRPNASISRPLPFNSIGPSSHS